MQNQVEFVIYIIAGTLLFILLAGFVITAVILNSRQRTKHASQLTDLEYQYEQEKLIAQLEIKEQTIHQISQELHDNIGQVLSLAKLYLRNQNPGEFDKTKITQARELISQSIADLRDISRSLNSKHISSLPLSQSLAKELEKIEKSGEIKTSFLIIGKEQSMTPEKRVVIFRIFQEVVSNVIRHSKAKNLSVNITYSKSRFNLNISDDGVGFIPKNLKTNGTGISNIKNRCQLINGEMEVRSEPGKGTNYSFSIPYLRKSA